MRDFSARTVIASEAKQSMPQQKKDGLLRRFAPRNDVAIVSDTTSSSRREAPELCIYLSPLRGRGECRMPVAPAASCALGIGKTHTSNNEYTGITRHSRTQWF